APWQLLYRRPDPHGQGALGSTSPSGTERARRAVRLDVRRLTATTLAVAPARSRSLDRRSGDAAVPRRGGPSTRRSLDAALPRRGAPSTRRSLDRRSLDAALPRPAVSDWRSGGAGKVDPDRAHRTAAVLADLDAPVPGQRGDDGQPASAHVLGAGVVPGRHARAAAVGDPQPDAVGVDGPADLEHATGQRRRVAHRVADQFADD